MSKKLLSSEREKPLNTLYLGSFDNPYDTEVYIANTLEMLGHKVTRRTTPRVTKKELNELLSKSWDAVLLSKGWFDFPISEVHETFNKYRKKQKYIGWFFDLIWGTIREKQLIYSHHIFKADLVLTTDGGNVERWKEAGINHKVLRQGIYYPEAIAGKARSKYAYDVVFVGTSIHREAFGWKYREELITMLKNRYGSRFKQFGHAGEIRNLELNDLYASAKVVVGDSVYSPLYWSNRIYETLGRGGFLIFPMIAGLEKEFIPYKHFIPYDYGNYNQLFEKIDYYISNAEDRNIIRKAGQDHCRENHSYTVRCKQLIKYIKEL
jgi:hypothetical protein